MPTGSRKKLMRVWYRTDAEAGKDYVGAFSTEFPMPEGWMIVNVDWSRQGEVQVTWLIPA